MCVKIAARLVVPDMNLPGGMVRSNPGLRAMKRVVATRRSFLVRTIPNALLLAYFQEKAIAIIIVQLISNLLICYMFSESGALMDLFQAISSIVAPISFGGYVTKIREHTHMTSAMCGCFPNTRIMVNMTDGHRQIALVIARR